MKQRNRCVLLLSALAAACSSGGGGEIGETRPRGEFVVVASDPVAGQVIYLNDPIAFDFSEPVDVESANLTTVAFAVLDDLGVPGSEFVHGSFSLGTRPGDDTPGRRLRFVPRYASDNDYQDGGFRSGTTYRVQLVGGSARNGTALQSVYGRRLEQPVTIEFSTVEGTQPPQLFRNPLPGGPRRNGFSVDTAASLDDVPLGLFGQPRLRVRLSFDQALNPDDRNVPVALDTDPLVRGDEPEGRIWLEYKDPELDDPNDPTDFTWLPALVQLERNDLDGAEVVLEPLGVLPNDVDVRVMVAAALEDIAGENNLGEPGYDPLFATFHTRAAYGQQWNAIVEDFRDLRNVDLGAVFAEANAELGAGFVRAGFDFGGSTTTLDFTPTTNEVVLDTSFTQLVPDNGLPFSVVGGVFKLRNVTIPQGVTVRGQGPNPMIWRVSGRFTVAGTLTVSGGNGARVDTLRVANVAKAGGVGVCGGGNGGQGTPSGSQRDARGETGGGPGQGPGTGGRGGLIACDSTCYNNPDPSFYNGSGGGSGGGGGGMATRGDLNWLGLPANFLANVLPNVSPTVNTTFQQLFGYGGAGCSGGTGARSAFLAGGEPGDLVFSDTRRDNDFWGSAIDLNRQLRITGELQVPVGGGGGGGGGDTCGPDGMPWPNDFSGGGGGAGGGVLIVQALEEIRITATGSITAEGGDGGGGEQAGNCGNAGGGGGGAGGMIVLMSARSIEIEAHGNAAQNRYLYGTPPDAQFAGGDFSYAVSADGGVGLVGTFGTGTDVYAKYKNSGTTMWNATEYDSNPAGGVGGLGLVQLMVPPGDDNADGTNTVLDDNIHFYLPGSTQPVTGLAKQQLLGWRGHADAAGDRFDDDGEPVAAVDGDIRPAPVLLPSPIQPRSRIRSHWIDTGRSLRRELDEPDGLGRGLVTSDGAVAGPQFAFAGTDHDGWVQYVATSAGSRAVSEVVVPPVAIATIDAGEQFLGELAYRVQLAQPVLGDEGRYGQYEAELLNQGGAVLQGYGILGHDADTLWLDARRGPVPDAAARLQVRAKFFELRVDGNESLGTVWSPQTSDAFYPRANVRIGFAFHRDPDPQDPLAGRFPATGAQDFVYDLDPASNQDLHDYLAGGAPRYVMWDVTFDLHFAEPGIAAPWLSANVKRPELHFLRLPFRF